MPVTISYDPEFARKAREYLIYLEDDLLQINLKDENTSELLLYLNKLITIHGATHQVHTESL
ncbi:hypothetical protein [Vibrio quintilis]|uniref:Uncharacterized protein n=1 Tax=Vibrio quintilis TaxID=1117707 RepID=A0A1M7YR99_9VIBR|nr:hypothetical protein [Vibrio quintilis]SHO55110.1 hypothetical protein VQ7734_00829 [Vibrio quintilis]